MYISLKYCQKKKTLRLSSATKQVVSFNKNKVLARILGRNSSIFSQITLYKITKLVHFQFSYVKQSTYYVKLMNESCYVKKLFSENLTFSMRSCV